MLVLGVHADEDDAAPARGVRGRRALARRRRLQARSGGGVRLARRRRRARRRLPGRVAREPALRARPRRCDGRPPGPRAGGRARAHLRPAGDRDRLVTGDPADPRARRGRVLDERRGDGDDRGAAQARRPRRRPGGVRARPVLRPDRLAGDARPGGRAAPPARRRGGRDPARGVAPGGRGRRPPRREGDGGRARKPARPRRRAAGRLRPASGRRRAAAERRWPGGRST